MYYVIQTIRNEQNEITERRIVSKSNQPLIIPGAEATVIEDADRDVALTKVSVDQSGNLFLEEDSDKVAAKATEDDIALRIKRIQFGQRLVAIMSIRNDAKELSGAQIVQLVQDFASINTAWLNGSIATSRALIDALTPDETILTTADKTAILAEIDANLASLGYE